MLITCRATTEAMALMLRVTTARQEMETRTIITQRRVTLILTRVAKEP